MSMVNMKSKVEREEMPGEVDADGPRYPYGLCIRLGKDELAKIGMTTLPNVGTGMNLMARATVKSVSSYDTQGEGADMSVELQITDLELGQMSASTNAANVLYGSDA
jgi:hypothetical protein